MAANPIPEYRLNDPGKAVGGCTGDFEPPSAQFNGPTRPGKTQQDHMPKDQRPRYQRWLKRQGK